MRIELPILPLGEGPGAFLAAYSSWAHARHMEHGEAYWRFALSGSSSAHARVQQIEEALSELHSQQTAFMAIERWRQAGVEDPLTARQLALLAPLYREAQVPAELRLALIRLSLEIEEQSSLHRVTLDGEQLSANRLDRILLTERNDGRRRRAWEASRQVGGLVSERVIELVQLRNEQARALGHSDYFAMALAHQEMDESELFALLDDLQARTEEPWRLRKLQLDNEFAPLRGKGVDELMPWDYPDRFLQSVPRELSGRSLDSWFGITRIHRHATAFFRGIGQPIDAIWEASDMIPADGKYPHAFCMGVDNPRDVRVLCNLDGTTRWMETTLHEFGHAIYDAGIDAELPFLLRNPAHTFVTEAVAMFFGRQARDPRWLQQQVGVPAEHAAAASRDRAEAQLVFMRWALLVTRFERAMYADPDADLNSLWWSLAGELQHLRRPDGWDEPDWAAKIHLACYPAYYQNYILGELLASQFDGAINERRGRDDAFAELSGRPDVGAFFAELFEIGQRLPWQGAIERSTGRSLRPDAWLRQFVGSS